VLIRVVHKEVVDHEITVIPLCYETMRSETKQPGTGPARKRKQHPRSHCSGGKPTTSSGVGSSSAGSDVIRNIKQEIRTYKTTALYLRGRDLIYPDALALARFNNWVEANRDEIDPTEQKVCQKCGQVDFALCAHSVHEDPPLPAPDDVPVVADRLRRHKQKEVGLWESLRYAFASPSFDTHSVDDDRLNGFTNDSLPNELVIPELFSYLVFNMQTSYVVSGNDDRALRLSHVHRLAQRWVILKNLETKLEKDQHLCVRFRLTIQRACDNAQNKMLYQHRDPVRNFGRAWLPKSRAEWCLLLLMVAIVCMNCSTIIGLAIRVWEITSFAGRVMLFLLNCVAASVPDLVPRILASVSAHPSGKVPSFQCVSTSYGVRWSAGQDAHAVTQYCQFSDWVAAGLKEAFYLTSETSDLLFRHMSQYRDEACGRLTMEKIGHQFIWASRSLDEALELGLMGPWDVIRLWFWTILSDVQYFLYRC